MTNLNSKIIQIGLVVLGIVLIVGTYYLYPQKKLEKLEKSETTISKKKMKIKKWKSKLVHLQTSNIQALTAVTIPLNSQLKMPIHL